MRDNRAEDEFKSGEVWEMEVSLEVGMERSKAVTGADFYWRCLR